MDTNPVVDFVPTEIAPTIEVPKNILPKLDNKSQALRLAKTLFGPLVRIDSKVDPVRVYVQKGSQIDELGRGTDLQFALEDAFKNMNELANSGKAMPSNIIPTRPNRNIVEEKRRDLVVKLHDRVESEVVMALHDNEVLDVTDLVQLRDLVAVGPYLAGAKVRWEAHKAQMARLQKAIEFKPNTKVPDDNLFNVPTEDVTVLK